MATKIEWAQETWNPVTGCTKISEGCLNCYAERITKRFWDKPFSQIVCHKDRLDQPSHWRDPRRIFVCSMSDLFHPDVPDEFIWSVFDEISHNRRHTYIILTKRPERMKVWFEKHSRRFWHYHAPDEPQHEYVSAPWPDPRIWLGVTAETQMRADERIPILLQIPAAVHFVSVEPMLSGIDLWQYLKGNRDISKGLDWVICGCESGPGARPMMAEWPYELMVQCQNAGVPFFHKQRMENGKIHKMPFLGDRVWDQYPEA